MTRTRTDAALLMAILSGALGGPATALAQHDLDLWVGRTSAGALQLGGLYEPGEPLIILLPPVNGLLQGWSDNDPGFDHVHTPQPALDLFPLQPGAEIWLEVTSLDPALRAIDAAFQVLDAPEEQTFLGDHLLHEHLTWHIDSTSGDFDALRTLWRGDFLLLDQGSTGYQPVALHMMFRNVDCITGDVDGDGQVDAADEQAFLMVLADPASATAQQRCAADCDLDGLVTPGDTAPCIALFNADCAALIAACADADGDGIRDDPCLWWTCADGRCVALHRDAGQADMGGFGGACAIDGACDINDKFHAQNCFANQDTQSQTPYPCEPGAPDALNVDAVGFAGSCALDGVCDINDAFAAENCFANQNTQGGAPFPCTCRTPAPQPQRPRR